MFSGWARKLYGRKPLRKGLLLRRKSEEIGALCLRQAKDLFGGLPGIELLENVPGFRNPTFPLPVIFWTFLCQVLSSGSCRSGLSSVQSLQSRHGKVLCSSNTAAFCKARVRIPMRLLYRSSERNLCRKLWKHLRAGDIIIADSGFCCWFTLYIFSQRGVKVVMRKTGSRKSDSRARKLGKGDVLEQ